MADAAKYAPINNGTQITDLKSKFSLPNTNKSVVCAYTSVFFFIAFTIFLAFSSSSNSSSPWFSNIFTTTFTTSKNGSDQNGNDSRIARSSELNQEPSLVNNETKRDDLYSKDAVFINKTTTILPPKTPQVGNIGTVDNVNISTTKGSSNLTKNLDQDETLKANKTDTKQGIKDMVKALVKCNLYDGNWVKDESYPLYEPGSCLLIDEKFNCFSNGRPDHDYYKLKWKPKGCSLPRLNGTHMLELLRGKRLVYVGDSLNRNMWESLICILRNFVKDKNKVYEENGRAHFKGESSYSFIFEDYAFRVEFYTSPFLVRQWEVSEGGEKIETLRLDLIGQSSEKYKDADFIIFNTGHWWTHDKTSRGKDYYQEGSHVYNELDVLEAFRRAITTWARWVDSNVNSSKTHVMFRGYSASHFRGGQWNSGGQCDRETEPMKNERYLRPYPPKMAVLDRVLKNMKNHVSYLNVTKMTDYRKDAHPSVYRKQRSTDLKVQDCSHWCLPGVPDTWNELLYAELLRSHFQNGQY